MISLPSGGLVPLSNPNQSVMNMLGVPKYTVNRDSNIPQDYGIYTYFNSHFPPLFYA
jgi:hypothetical protein